MIRGTGFLPSKPDARDYKFAERFGTSAPVTGTIDYSGLIAGVEDQGQTSSCVEEALAAVTYVTAKLQGEPIPKPSVLAWYSIARFFAFPENPSLALQDNGSNPRDACKAAQKAGIIADSTYPFDVAKVSQPLPWSVLRQGIDAKLESYAVLDGIGTSALPASIDQALANKTPPILCLPITKAFQNWTGSGIMGLDVFQGPVVGGHGVACLGRQNGSHLILNSYGTSWGQGGFAWVSDDVWASAIPVDAVAVTVVRS